ncbi:MAG: DUF45 domain-containing protein, partial [Negativicutes bacterium]|nr:DUF45 domain-containing protein [Negativicutes bacterium]
MQINIQNRLFQWTINRSSNRRTVQLRLVSPEVLEVAAPNRITTAELEALVKTKAAWILRQADKLEALSYNPFNAGIADGVKLLYRGKSYTLLMLGAYQAQV